MSNDNTTASRRGFLGGVTAVGMAGVPAAARALGGYRAARPQAGRAGVSRTGRGVEGTRI
jgi:hypothetical protein